jgi:hypothetical protein
LVAGSPSLAKGFIPNNQAVRSDATRVLFNIPQSKVCDREKVFLGRKKDI